MPGSLSGQLRYVRQHWAPYIGDILDRLLLALDVMAEEERGLALRAIGGLGGGADHAEPPQIGGLEGEIERFSEDRDWMPRLVLMAKSTYVWLDQLSRRYEREIRTLDAIPDEELDRLAQWGISGLWLIGLWERSRASETIKRLRGNPEAVASAYSLDDYRDRRRPRRRGRLRGPSRSGLGAGHPACSDMVPNHMGIDSRWVVEHPERFLSLGESPFPSYSFSGPDLSPDDRVALRLEDHYWDATDAAVVFQRVDRGSGDVRYVYHGNDGTSFPWNDTAQINYLDGDVREAVIQTVLAVARRFPIIRFDAAMVLAKRHVERLWFPEPGAGGAIPSRAEHGSMSKDEFESRMPTEFWRDVVDRVATEVPGTLLLAEAFWLMEGYFVRTLGMHRVYNSAFMHMLRDEDNSGYRKVIRDTLEFDPEILKRYVNFMSNPDEKTAVEQFGKGDKYFGVATLLATLPGLPMFGHGQVEGFAEKYGMEYRRAYHDETPDHWLVERHERELFPLFHRRGDFADVADFSLYDFATGDGSTDENVFVYSNGRGGSRSLVVYHNRFGSTAGWVRDSVAFAVKHEGGKRIERRRLGEALEVAGDRDALVAFRDRRGGLEYLRPAAELREQGLYLELDAYRCHVFGEFREVRDGVAGQWSRLASQLGGRGVPNLDDALRELQLEPVHEPLRALVAGPLATLVAEGAAPDPGSLAAALEAFGAATAAATGVSGSVKAYRSAVAERLHAIAGAGAVAGAGAGATIASGDGRRGPDSVLGSYADSWHRAVLVGWSVLEPLGGLAPKGMVGPTSRAWFDELRLGPVLAASLRAAGLDESEAWTAAERVRSLLALPRPSNVTARSHADRARRLVEAWLDHPDVRPLIRVNRWEGVEWFGRDEWRELVDWSLLLDHVDDGEAALPSRSRAVAAVLLEAAESSGYRADRLLESLSPAAATPRKPPSRSR